jgi:hypothetical protein
MRENIRSFFMRKAVIIAGLIAFAAVPFLANATVVPAAMSTVLLQDTSTDTAPAPIPVKKHSNFLPLALAGLAIVGGGTAAATTGGSGNSPG